MAEQAATNIFGQTMRYVSPTLTAEQQTTVIGILNAIADDIQGQLSREEFTKEVSNIQATVQFVVSEVNTALAGAFRVDGVSLKPLLIPVIKERIAGYYANITFDVTGNGSVNGPDKVLKDATEPVIFTVSGDVVSCSEDIVDGKITFPSGITEDLTITIEFEIPVGP